MRYVNKFSYNCANRLSLAMKEDHQKRSVYYFSFQIIFGALVKNLILILTALLFGALFPALVISVIFASLRMLAGGYHMDTYGKCLAVSLSMFMLAALTAQYTCKLWPFISLLLLIVLTLLFGLAVLIRYAPKDTPHKLITEPAEIRKFKTLSVIWLIILIIGAVVLASFDIGLFAISICFAILLELFMVTPLGNNFFEIIKNGISIKSRKKRV